MARAQENFHSYRVVWNISEICFHSYASHKFTLGGSKWFLAINRKNVQRFSGEVYCVVLRGAFEAKQKVIRSSYYLLNEDDNKKLKNLTFFETRWFEHRITGNTILVCAFDLICEASEQSSEQWIEGTTKGLNSVLSPETDTRYLKQYSFAFSRQKQMINFKLSYNPLTSTVKSIGSGLKKGQCVMVNSLNFNDLALFCIKQYETEYKTNQFGNTLILNCMAFEFKEMTQHRISEIDELIQNCFSDSLRRNDNNNSYSFKSNQQHSSRNVHTLIEKAETPVSIGDTAIRTSSKFPSLADKLLTMPLPFFHEIKAYDITIKILNSGHKIQAHKLMLVSGSTVWKQLLSNDKELSIITVPHLDQETVEALVAFIYYGSEPKPSVDIVGLLIAAATYGVDGLKDWCEQLQ